MELVDCSTPNCGCNDGMMGHAFSLSQHIVIVTESMYVYTAGGGTCRTSITTSIPKVIPMASSRSMSEVATSNCNARGQPPCIQSEEISKKHEEHIRVYGKRVDKQFIGEPNQHQHRKQEQRGQQPRVASSDILLAEKIQGSGGVRKN